MLSQCILIRPSLLYCNAGEGKRKAIPITATKKFKEGERYFVEDQVTSLHLPSQGKGKAAKKTDLWASNDLKEIA